MSENTRGAIDLSKFANDADGAGQSFVLDVGEADFEALASKSLQYPVILELTLPSAKETRSVDEALVDLANAAGGKWLLARVDVQAAPAIAQALGVQAVPTVLALLGGQVMPLFQGTADSAQISGVIDQVLQLALANGIVGKAAPVPGGAAHTPANGSEAAPKRDPRFAAADAAVAAGDLATARSEFDKLLAANPSDQGASSGRAQVSVLLRTAGVDRASVLSTADAQPDDVAAALAAADVELAQGAHAAAFTRLLELLKTRFGDEREPIRLRLLELFAACPPDDPDVAKARRDLAAALF